MGKNNQGQKKIEQPKCIVCNQIFKNHVFVGGKTIKDICNCNLHLLNEEADRILQKRGLK